MANTPLGQKTRFMNEKCKNFAQKFGCLHVFIREMTGNDPEVDELFNACFDAYKAERKELTK